MISKWNDFLRSINEEAEESKIYTRRGDPFEYKVVSDNWHAKRIGTKKWYNISGEDFIKKYQKSICILDNEFPGARTPDAPKRKECQESSGKTQEKTAQVAPEKTAQVAPEKTAQVAPEKTTQVAPSSEKPKEQPQKVEESRMFTSNDPKSVDNTILEMVKSGNIYLNYRNDKNSKYVKKVDIVVKSGLPISDSDGRILELYFKGAGLEAGAPSLKNQRDNQIKRGDKIHYYKFIPESNECTEDVPLKEDNHLSYFLHFYYAGQLKKRGLFGLGKRFKLKGVEVSPETLKKVEEFAQALIYKPAVKYVEKEKADNQTNQPGQQQEKSGDKNSSVGTLEDTSTDQATAQRKAMRKYNKLSGIDGRTKKIIDQKASQLPDGKYKYEIKYELTNESKKIHSFKQFANHI